MALVVVNSWFSFFMPWIMMYNGNLLDHHGLKATSLLLWFFFMAWLISFEFHRVAHLHGLRISLLGNTMTNNWWR